MARMARIVAPGIPHHITQRGNRHQRVFFADADYRAYKQMIGQCCRDSSVEVWAYCLMPNHVHLILVAQTEQGLRRAVGEAHKRYTRRINAREGWRGYLWEGRFGSCPMDEPHLLRAAPYVELNPVRAGLCERPEQWPWSSARAHLAGRDDDLVTVLPLLGRVQDWRRSLQEAMADTDYDVIRRHQRTGRPLGSDTFIDRLETLTGQRLRPRKRGRKPKNGN